MTDRVVSFVRRNPAAYRLAQRLRLAGLSAADAAEALTTRRRALVPPRRYRLVGGGDFTAVGRRFVAELVDLGRLEPNGAVLDIGCGVGRMAIPLLGHLEPEGRYRGFDVVPEWIRWCTDHVTARHSGFRFTVADIENRKYNPAGRFQASTYRFPYDSESFDVAFATSVFTHLMRDDVDNYVREAARVLSPGGRLLATFHLLNPRTFGRMRMGDTAIAFRDGGDGVYVADPSLPELSVAYEENAVRELYARHGLEILEPMRYGSWSGNGVRRGRQDLVVARRTG